MEINPNVDDLLAAQRIGKPLDPLPDISVVADAPRETIDPKIETLQPKVEAKVDQVAPEKPKEAPKETNEYGDTQEAKVEEPKETNEYGLEAEAPKSYSKAEMDAYANQIVRERLARLERNQQQPQQPTQQQQNQAQQQGFQYNEDSNLDWQQQLEQFVYQVADKREQHRAAQVQQAVQQVKMQEFESKFKQGMEKFNDYRDVVGKFDIKDDMLMAASDINDPAALFYAAAKRMPEELAKIASMDSELKRAAAIGRLDEKLRKSANKVSSAPKPVSQTKADTTVKAAEPKQSSNELDDMLIADNAKRVALLNSRRR